MINPIHPIGIKVRKSQTTPGTYHPGIWNIQTVEWEIKPSMENNIGGERKISLKNSSGSTTSQKATGSRPVYNQAEEEALSHQERDTEERS